MRRAQKITSIIGEPVHLKSGAKMTEGKMEQEAVEEIIRDLGVSEAKARFILAIERGEIDGDEVVIQPGEPLPE